MNASNLTVENVAAVIGVGLTAAFFAIKKYLAERREPSMAKESQDLAILAGASLTDMRAVKEIGQDLKQLVLEMRRIADAAERVAKFEEQAAEEAEIERRALARAAEMLAEDARKRR